MHGTSGSSTITRGHGIMKAIHPGRVLRRELESRKMSANALALALRTPSGRIGDILQARNLARNGAAARPLLRRQRDVLAQPPDGLRIGGGGGNARRAHRGGGEAVGGVTTPSRRGSVRRRGGVGLGDATGRSPLPSGRQTSTGCKADFLSNITKPQNFSRILNLIWGQAQSSTKTLATAVACPLRGLANARRLQRRGMRSRGFDRRGSCVWRLSDQGVTAGRDSGAS